MCIRDSFRLSHEEKIASALLDVISQNDSKDSLEAKDFIRILEKYELQSDYTIEQLVKDLLEVAIQVGYEGCEGLLRDIDEGTDDHLFDINIKGVKTTLLGSSPQARGQLVEKLNHRAEELENQVRSLEKTGYGVAVSYTHLTLPTICSV